MCYRTLSNGGAIGLGGRGQLPSSPQGGKSSDFKCPVYLQMPHEYEYKLLIGTDQVSSFVDNSFNAHASIIHLIFRQLCLRLNW